MAKIARGKALVAKLRAQAGVRDPEALAAWLGRFKKARKRGLSVEAAKKAADGESSNGSSKSGVTNRASQGERGVARRQAFDDANKSNVLSAEQMRNMRRKHLQENDRVLLRSGQQVSYGRVTGKKGDKIRVKPEQSLNGGTAERELDPLQVVPVSRGGRPLYKTGYQAGKAGKYDDVSEAMKLSREKARDYYARGAISQDVYERYLNRLAAEDSRKRRKKR